MNTRVLHMKANKGAAAGKDVNSAMSLNQAIDRMQIYNYPGIDVFSDPVHTTKRLYK